jgi:two-component system OmpR family response regulator
LNTAKPDKWYDYSIYKYKKWKIVENYKRALIIDDDDDLCQMLKTILSNTFDIVQYTHNLEMGKKLLSHSTPDVVFLDNNLPDGQGLSLIKYIKENLSSTAVILITAMGNSREKAIEYGADVFLEKPLTYSSIFNALDKATHKHVNL